MSTQSPRPLPRRLRKRVAESLRVSLQQVERYFQAGRVRFEPAQADTEPATLDTLVFAEDRVWVDEQELGAPPAHVYALLNKPKGVTASARDPEGKRDLSAYLREMPPGCFAVGRLDRETTGLLLFTTDGDLASAVSRSEHEALKRYWLWLDDPLEADDPRVQAFVDGVLHEGERLVAKSARIVMRYEHGAELELRLAQGKNRQIRHMCRALDLHLVHLHRSGIGPLSDAELALGAWRPLGDVEVGALWDSAGGRLALRHRQLERLRRRAQQGRSAGTPRVRLEAWLALEGS